MNLYCTITNSSAASELIVNRIMNAGKFVSALNLNSKGPVGALKRLSLEAQST